MNPPPRGLDPTPVAKKPPSRRRRFFDGALCIATGAVFVGCMVWDMELQDSYPEYPRWEWRRSSPPSFVGPLAIGGGIICFVGSGMLSARLLGQKPEDSPLWRRR